MNNRFGKIELVSYPNRMVHLKSCHGVKVIIIRYNVEVSVFTKIISNLIYEITAVSG